jgi:dTDP-4-amino-4,6-dideoxygalactose transaminase
MNIPLVDLRAQHDELRADILAAFSAVLDESAFVGGSRVVAFETAYAAFCGASFVSAVASGTDALEFSLRALGVGRGDLIVTSPHTFFATVEAPIQLGASPRFVDIDPTTFNLDPNCLAEYFHDRCSRDAQGVLRETESGARIGAIVPVHLYGLPADMNAILPLAAEFGVPVLEDACQAHGAEYRVADGGWKRVGTLGQIGCFSFFPSKNLGAMGEAGAVTTNDVALDSQVRVFRDHGQRERYIHVSPLGVNGRMDTLQAAMLTVKLARLDAWNEKRREVAGWYAEDLAGTGVALPLEPVGSRHVYHIYAIRLPNRDVVKQRLAERGISTGLHYPIPLHRQPALAELGLGPGSFPNAERAASEVLSLPMYPHLTREQVRFVSSQLIEAIG